MAYDTYGRPQRGDRINGEPSYFEPKDSTPEYMSHYSSSSTEPRDNYHPSSLRRPAESSNAQRHRYSPPLNDKMTSDTAAVGGHDHVSPEIIAAITEKIKKEVFEHLKQTGTVEDPNKAPAMQRRESNISNSTASPPQTAKKVYTPPSPIQLPRFSNTAQAFMDSARSPPTSPLEKQAGLRFSGRGPPRPTGGPRSWSTAELSTIDQKWGRLFDEEGNPTQRIGQFLRGLANHIIDDFPPKKSIVVTPSKMAAYYTQHAIDKEPHPLINIFRAQSNEQISRLYQDLGCQHHLVQEHSSMAPIVPALTPVGFAHWMTINILSYPEEESRRLEKVVQAMPIDADGEMVDGKPERLPKQVSRYLLPEKEDRKSKKLLDHAIEDFFEDLGTTQRRKASLPSRVPSQSPPRASRTSPPLSRQSSTSQSRRDSQSRHPTVEIHQNRSPTNSKAPGQPIERERKPYAGAPSNSETSSNEESNIKLERDRQPYSAQPGVGRVYEKENLNLPNSRPRRANSTSRTREPDIPESRPYRTHSNASRENYIPPPQSSGRRTSSPRGASGRRASSPPMKSFSHSTPTDIDCGSKYPPSSSSSSFNTFNTGSFPAPPPPLDISGRTRSRDQYGRRAMGASEDGIATEFISPRDAERWDKYQEAQSARGEFDRPYERSSVSIDPARGAPVEEWYREKGRGSGYDDYRRY